MWEFGGYAFILEVLTTLPAESYGILFNLTAHLSANAHCRPLKDADFSHTLQLK